MENIEKKKAYLSKLIDNIKEQYITLEEINFKKIKNFFSLNPKNVNLEHNLTMKIDVGKISNEKDKLPYLSISYKLEEKIYTDENLLLDNSIEYKLHLILNSNSDIDEIISMKDVLESYAKTTGILTIYPYIRNLAHNLHKEAGLNIPPYPPLKI